MQKLSRITTLFTVFFLSTSSFGQWVENFYECVCYSGSRAECVKKIENDYPEFRDFISMRASAPPEESLWLSQLRAAEIILEQRAAARPEESRCLIMAKNHISHALEFSLKEKMERRPDADIYLKALYDLGKETYQWAEENCFNQPQGSGHNPGVTLPNPKLCRRSH